MKTKETIKNKKGDIIAIIIRHSFKKEGIHFFTPAYFSQQMAFISHKAGTTIKAHGHNKAKREISMNQEVLFIRKGSIKVNLYDSGKKFIASRILEKGDVVLLSSGAHGFEILKDIQVIEVKQGPYLGDKDKVLLFKGIK